MSQEAQINVKKLFEVKTEVWRKKGGCRGPSKRRRQI